MNEIKYGLAWSKDFELGYGQVDAQHRRLFELVSELVSACMEGLDAKKLRETLDFLVNYTVQHFTDEEALQIRCKYPGYERHRQLHEDFKVTVGELVREFDLYGSTVELSNNVNKIVVKWLINHIQREDKRIGDHIHSSGYA